MYNQQKGVFMDYEFLLDGINKIEKIQEEQSIAIAMLQGYIFAAKTQNDDAAASSTKKKSPTVIKIDVPKGTDNGSVIVTQGEDLRKYNGKTIRKRSDGRYEIRYYDGKKYHSIYGKTQNECITKLKDILNDKKKDKVNYKSITLGEWLEQWLKLYKQNKVAKTTFDQMQRYLKEVQPLYHYPLKKISPIILQEFLNQIEKPRKREKIHLFLKDAFSKACKARIIEYNPFEAVESVKRDKKQSRSLTHEEEKLFVEACLASQYGNLYLVCLYSGMRIGEALALTQEDIDYKNKTISINKSINEFDEIVAPKTKTSIRVIPLFQKVEEIVKNITTEKLFLYTKTTYQNKIAAIRKKLNLQNVSTHTMRHTFATRCAEAGIPPKVIQKWLGHSTIEMTMNVYTHVNNDYEQEMVSKINDFSTKI